MLRRDSATPREHMSERLWMRNRMTLLHSVCHHHEFVKTSHRGSHETCSPQVLTEPSRDRGREVHPINPSAQHNRQTPRQRSRGLHLLPSRGLHLLPVSRGIPKACAKLSDIRPPSGRGGVPSPKPRNFWNLC